MHLADWKHTAHACSSLRAAEKDCKIEDNRKHESLLSEHREKSLQSPAMFLFCCSGQASVGSAHATFAGVDCDWMESSWGCRRQVALWDVGEFLDGGF
ncbi:hypothetical protein JTE90_025837 [Oedothorax gibbosus]|uniref:Uncharacterized protein n=1 Tax=Oedothorax gibbosus TaxID=931172 RepID=A0AAV6UU98_9ARAC|nr:hypothetical protein JTE90_025837 [Oedothorax gibbosus]